MTRRRPTSRRGRPQAPACTGLPLEQRVLFAIHLLRLRLHRDLTQHEAARRSGVGEKTISSFESGSRVSAIKVRDLAKLLSTYNTKLSTFFADIEAEAESSRRHF